MKYLIPVAVSVLGCVFALYLAVYAYLRLTLGVYRGTEDMSGKTVIVTGASAGIGKATAMDLAHRNARVLLACRNVDKAQKVADHIKMATGNQDVLVKQLDLCSFESVRKCAQEILDTEERIDVLINSAGVVNLGIEEHTEDGHEIVIQTNHLSPFLFTLLLIDLLKSSAPSRIVIVTSHTHKFGKLDLEDLDNISGKASDMQRYSNSKLSNVLFSKELAKRLGGTGVTVNCAHPGLVNSDIAKDSKGLISKICKANFRVFGKSCEEGAQTSIRLTVDPSLERTTGKYFADCKEETPQGQGNDDDLAEKLFEATERIVGVAYPSSS